MKILKFFVLSIVSLAMVLGFTMQAHADLTNLGTDSFNNRLIYDTDLDITWYDYTNSVNTWNDQVSWADGLSVTFGSNIYTDWRLPTTVDGTYVYGYDGTTTAGYNITSSEMGHLFYTELGNNGYVDTSGNYPGAGNWGLNNTGDFQNLLSGHYWSGEYSADPSYAWDFNTYDGKQDGFEKDYDFYAIAVRPGLAVAPEPMSMILFITGGAVMAGRMTLRRRRHG